MERVSVRAAAFSPFAMASVQNLHSKQNLIWRVIFTLFYNLLNTTNSRSTDCTTASEDLSVIKMHTNLIVNCSQEHLVEKGDAHEIPVSSERSSRCTRAREGEKIYVSGDSLVLFRKAFVWARCDRSSSEPWTYWAKKPNKQVFYHEQNALS